MNMTMSQKWHKNPSKMDYRSTLHYQKSFKHYLTLIILNIDNEISIKNLNKKKPRRKESLRV